MNKPGHIRDTDAAGQRDTWVFYVSWLSPIGDPLAISMMV